MKNVMLGFLVMGFLAGGVFAQAPEKKVVGSLNLGIQTNLMQGSSFDVSQGTLDLRIGICLGKSFLISPEVMYATSHKFHFNYGFVYPGVVFNFVAKPFFIGAGAVLPVTYGGGSTDTGNLAPKFNVGHMGEHFVLTAYIVMWREDTLGGYWNFPHFNYIGTTFRFVF
jgi:hypothetical protein